MISTGNSGGSAKAKVAKPSGELSGPAHGENEDNDEEFDVDKATDMDEEYGQIRTKRTKSEKKDGIVEKASGNVKGQLDIKSEDSDESDGSSASQKKMQVVKTKKRKREIKKTGLGKGKSLPKGKGLKPSVGARRSSLDYEDLTGGYDAKDKDNSGDEVEYVGARAPYMKFAESPESYEDEDKVIKQRAPLSKSATPSKVVVLQVGTAHLLQEARRLEADKAIKSELISDSDEEEEIESETEEQQVEAVEQPVDLEHNFTDNGVFGAMYANQGAATYHQYNNPSAFYGGFNPAANAPLTAGHPYSSLASNNRNWFSGPGYTQSSLSANGVPNYFGQPFPSSTRVTIPQQVSGPNVEMVPTSATSTYSGHTPVLMGDQYYAALEQPMAGMGSFSQTYLDPADQEPPFDVDDGFEYFNL